MKILLFLWLILFTFSFATKPETPGQVASAQSGVTFKVGHISGKVTGTFSGMEGSVNFDENNLAGSAMDVSLDATTINTKNKARDSDLKKEKFFDVEKYPKIRFKSNEISRTTSGFQVLGDLTIKDVTREELIPFTVENKEKGKVFTGQFTVDRKAYNLGKSSFPPIGKTVEVTITALIE